MTRAAESVLSAGDLSFGYRTRGAANRPVLADFSLALQPREIVAVLGPSGIGKSTLLRILAGLERPDSGQVELFGAPLRSVNPALGVVFQAPSLLPWRNLRENVALGLGFASRARRGSVTQRAARVDAVLAELGLVDAAEYYPAELSGGMAQRASLARCLAREPRILLLDEPFAALDAATRATMQALLRQLADAHAAAAVLVTHDIDEALRVADRVLLLSGHPAVLAGCWALPPAPPGTLRTVAGALRETIVAALAAASLVVPPGPAVACQRKVA